MLARALRLLFGVAVLQSAAPATHPEVTAVAPRGGKRGTEVTLQIYGNRLQTIEGLVLFRPGIEVLEVKPDKANQASVRIRIAADCPLGRHPLLVRTAYGLSRLHLFFVGTLDEVSEKEPNNDPEQAQKVGFGTTVNGRITAEDSDVFAVDVKKGQVVNIEVQGLRLGDQEFDAHLTVHDAAGKRLAQVDDTIFGLLDPLTSLRAERDETWTVTVRENARGGSNTSFYRLHVGTFPRPLVAFPAGGPAGKKNKVRLLGEAQDIDGVIEPDADGLYRCYYTDAAGTAPTPITFAASPLVNVLEASKEGPLPKPGAISGWSMIGPFANPRDKQGRSLGHGTTYPPEKDLDPKKKHKGRDGEVAWTPQNFADDVVHDLRKLVKTSDDSVVYLARTITTDSARRVLFLLSADDTLKVFCNGKVVLDDPKPGAATPGQHRLVLDLQRGANTLLLKVSNRGGGLGFYCRILDPLRLQKTHRTFTAPCALNGILDKPGEQDNFVFLARKGEALDLELIGRGLRSPIDPVGGIYCTHDRFYVGNDDTSGLDALLRFRAPFTGEFVLTVRDMLQDGGPRHVYRVEVDRPRARPMTTRVTVPGYQYEWSVDLPAGGRNAVLLTAADLDRGAGPQLTVRGLPKGVTATIPPFAAGATSVPVVFHAAADTPRGAHLLEVDATATVKDKKVEGAHFHQDVVTVEARNQRGYLATPIERLPLAVTSPAPFTITVPKVKVPVVRGSRLDVPFEVAWAKDFKGAARFRLLTNPPGVSSSQVSVRENQTRGVLSLYANGGAATGVHQIVIVGLVPVAGANISASSDLVDLEVSRPWIEADIGKVRSEPGHKVDLEITFKRTKEFAGKVEAQWVGVPRDIACAVPAVTAETKKLSIPVDIGDKAPPGRHRGFRLRLLVHTPDGVVTNEFGNGEIRVDRPRKQPVKKATGVGSGSGS